MNRSSFAGHAVYFAWTQFQRRQVSMEKFFGYESVFLPLRWKNGLLAKALSYFINAVSVLKYSLLNKPSVVWIQLPQVPLLWPVLLYKLINRKTLIIADCHNAMFRKPWCKFPFGLSIIHYCDAIVVHNETQKLVAIEHGLPSELLVVLEDAPASISFEEMKGVIDLTNPRPWFLFPASFAEDEPISELIDVAIEIPEVTFFITGSLARAKQKIDISKLPPNIHLMGFLPLEQFDWLLLHCDVVMALTKYDGIQLSVCNEAIGFGKPMLVSGTPLLRKLFPKGTVFIDNESKKDFIRGCNDAIQRNSELVAEMEIFQKERWETWQKQAELLTCSINNDVTK